MFEKLIPIAAKYEDIEFRLSLPETAADPSVYTALIKEYHNLTPLVEAYRLYRGLEDARTEALELASLGDDPELKALAEDEAEMLKGKLAEAADELQRLLIPKDPEDDCSVIMELRAGTGGEEAALFAADLFRMYSMYAQSNGFKVSITSATETELGGYREVTFLIEGKGAYSRFKFESGVHRVQRVPATESQGRIQTSAATVAVLPEVQDVEIEIKDSDLVFESCKSSGAGGQHINKTESAVRLTHKPSGIVIECDQERSQLQNKEKAMRLLYAKLYDIKQREQAEAIASTRKSQVGSGDRSEKIRTYNFPQSRVTDHRINKTIYSLGGFLNGDMDSIVDELIAVDTAERLKGEQNGN